MGPIEEPQDMLGGLNFSPKVKKQVQALLTKSPILPGYSSMHKPDFVYLLEGDPEGIISCTHHSLKKLKILAFQQAIFQPIWRSFGRSTRSKTATARSRGQSSTPGFELLFGQPNQIHLLRNFGALIYTW